MFFGKTQTTLSIYHELALVGGEFHFLVEFVFKCHRLERRPVTATDSQSNKDKS